MNAQVDFVLTRSTFHLKDSLAKFSNVILPKIRDFPDGEIYVRIPKMPNNDVFVVHSGSPDPNKGLAELRINLSILKENKIDSNLIFTYMPYARQDKVFKYGESNVAESLVKEFINNYLVTSIYTIDAHFMGQEWVNKYALKDISSVEYLKRAVEKDHSNVVYMVPDGGAARRTGLPAARKTRESAYKISMELSQDLTNIIQSGKPIAIIDDMISTGGTMVKIASMAKEINPNIEIFALATHGILNQGLEKVSNAFSRLYITNSTNIKGDANIVDLGDIIYNSILTEENLQLAEKQSLF